MNKSSAAICGTLVVLMVLVAFIRSSDGVNNLTQSSRYSSQDIDASVVADNTPSVDPDSARRKGGNAHDSINNEIGTELVLGWDNSLSTVAFLGELEANKLIDEAGTNYFMHSWLRTCHRAQMFAADVELNDHLGRKEDIVQKLLVSCDGVLPESFHFAESEDVTALQLELDSLFHKTAYLETWKTLHANFEDGGESVVEQMAADILARAMDPGALQAAINSLLVRGFFDSPLLSKYRNLAFSQGFYNISNDVATVLFCDRVGGCIGADHPIVLQRCFESNLGCNRPVDIHDAIFQLTPPVDYEIYSALLLETRRFMVRQRRR